MGWETESFAFQGIDGPDESVAKNRNKEEFQLTHEDQIKSEIDSNGAVACDWFLLRVVQFN